MFTVISCDSGTSARTGILQLEHGPVSTPVFMPVGTKGTVKAITDTDLKEIGFEIILSNTYHLYLQPGMEVIQGIGGLHQFMNWDRNILTDSGGFQIFSLSGLRKINTEGAWFQSHIDGAKHFISPEKAVEIQCILGSDIQMQLDVCNEWGSTYKDSVKSLDITIDWMFRAKSIWETYRDKGYKNSLFSIVQGNFFSDLRKRSVDACIAADTPGIAIGGLSVGEPPDLFYETLHNTASLLPKEKPRYVMGIGTPEYILFAIENGIDMFDCVLPTREGRNGRVFTRNGPIAIKKRENRMDFLPIDKECTCKVCRQYSRAYLRHLFKTQEILFSMLASYHNLFFLHQLILNARTAISENRFSVFKKEFLSQYKGDSNEN